MKKTALNFFAFVITALMVAVNASAAMAAPRLTLTPISGSYTNGSTFTVSIGVSSETEKTSAVDVWATFDATKLEVESIVKSTNPPFSYDITPTIDNVTGKFNFSAASTNMSAFDDAPANGELAVVTFKTKSPGTANLNFTCTPGSTTDSNIFNSDLTDIISCSANSSGSYTITGDDGAGTDTITEAPTATVTSAATVAPTKVVTKTATTSATLPQTGGIDSTIGLIVFGVISLTSALFLKFL